MFSIILPSFDFFHFIFKAVSIAAIAQVSVSGQSCCHLVFVFMFLKNEMKTNKKLRKCYNVIDSYEKLNIFESLFFLIC